MVLLKLDWVLSDGAQFSSVVVRMICLGVNGFLKRHIGGDFLFCLNCC